MRTEPAKLLAKSEQTQKAENTEDNQISFDDLIGSGAFIGLDSCHIFGIYGFHHFPMLEIALAPDGQNAECKDGKQQE